MMRYLAKYAAQLRRRGWVYSSDLLGEYAQRGQRRVSVMRVGPLFDVYVNDHVNGAWAQVFKQTGLMTIEHVIQVLNAYL